MALPFNVVVVMGLLVTKRYDIIKPISQNQHINHTIYAYLLKTPTLPHPPTTIIIIIIQCLLLWWWWLWLLSIVMD